MHAIALPTDGRQRVVVFWDPTCPACSNALPDLRAWDDVLGPEQLLVVSRGRPDRVDELGLRAAVALDDGATRAFGVRGTPSAILLDASGAIAAPVAAGAPAIDVLVALAAQPGLVAA